MKVVNLKQWKELALNRKAWNDLFENGCKANGIIRRSGWFHRFKAHANFDSVKMFNTTVGGWDGGVFLCVYRSTVYVGVCLSVEEIRMQENKKFTHL